METGSCRSNQLTVYLCSVYLCSSQNILQVIVLFLHLKRIKHVIRQSLIISLVTSKADWISSWNKVHVMKWFFVCLFALPPKSTAMVIAGRSVHLTTLFSWASLNKQLTSNCAHTFVCNHEMVIDLLKRFICMKNIYFLQFFISFKYDFHVDPEKIRRNVKKYPLPPLDQRMQT